MLSPETSYDVFIAYNSADRPKVKEVVTILKQKGIMPWFDQNISVNVSWFDQLRTALPRCACVVFFIGPNGIGRWQKNELELVKFYAVERREIPVKLVKLPGDFEIPDIFRQYFPGSWIIEFIDPIEETDELLKLIDSIHEAIVLEMYNRTFEIEIDIKNPRRSCFLSISKTGHEKIFSSVKKVFENISKKNKKEKLEINLLQKRNKSGEDKTYIDDDVYHVIRESELVIAVCMPDNGTNNISPEVIYELGLAHALGKPGIVISSVEQNIENWIRSLGKSTDTKDQDNFETALPATEFMIINSEDEDKFVNDLEETVEKIVRGIPEPYLISAGVEGIHTLRRDIAYVRTNLWPHFCAILSFGLGTLRNFSDIFQQCHVLLIQGAELSRKKQRSIVRGEMQPGKSFWSQYFAFCKGCNNLLKFQNIWEQKYLRSLDSSKAEIEKSFNFLTIHLFKDFIKYVNTSRKFYDNVFDGDNSHIKSYESSFKEIRKWINNKSTVNWPHIEDEEHQIKLLEMYLRFIDHAIHNMMDELLKIIIGEDKTN